MHGSLFWPCFAPNRTDPSCTGGIVLRLLIVLLLAGCGGGDHCQPLETVRVQLFGDSTMVNLDAWTKTDRTALERWADSRFGKGVVRFENRAVPGTTSQNLIDGDGLNAPWAKPNADVIVVNHGLNDAARVEINAYRANLRIFGTGTRIVYVTPNAAVPGVTPLPDAYAAAMREVAADLRAPVADVFAYTIAGDLKVTLLDGVHPMPATEQAIADHVVAPALEPVVSALRCER